MRRYNVLATYIESHVVENDRTVPLRSLDTSVTSCDLAENQGKVVPPSNVLNLYNNFAACQRSTFEYNAHKFSIRDERKFARDGMPSLFDVLYR